ncbi:hypothetical protein HELRODRAFT_174673 [Helobdella robusta]|uniref:RCK N-terminal domain-containing protein n=1 Tax=Helobdella robusta TaxID=6412 RepID=T1F8C9_HELRO|nr:hypothetical protein HELRODRAFT_174673 [Helobdella robusta]ESO01702.1 hypothetical protein HELRODRAFT_174673 [Helobdella robusta]
MVGNNFTLLGRFNFYMDEKAMFASFIPEIMDILGTRSKYGGAYKTEGGKKHIVLCGHITYESVTNFMSDFLHKDREDMGVVLVIMNRKEPDLELEGLFKRHLTQVEYFQGTVMDANDLHRVNCIHSLPTDLHEKVDQQVSTDRLCFLKLKLLLIAIEAKQEGADESYILINPRYDVKLESNIRGFFIAESADEVKRAYYYCQYCHYNTIDYKQIKKCLCRTGSFNEE